MTLDKNEKQHDNNNPVKKNLVQVLSSLAKCLLFVFKAILCYSLGS